MMVVDSAFREEAILVSGRPDLRDLVAGLYSDLAAEIARRRPVCVASGRCCKFEAFGHRLFVTTLEMGVFWGELELDRRPEGAGKPGCPFQKNRLCSVHKIRPFGCRMFFCDASAGQWQNEQYELFHARLKAMHASAGVRYFYVEWRDALRAMQVG